MIYINNKTGGEYHLMQMNIINATNANDGQKMVLYRDKNWKLFVREEKEFKEKFTSKVG